MSSVHGASLCLSVHANWYPVIFLSIEFVIRLEIALCFAYPTVDEVKDTPPPDLPPADKLALVSTNRPDAPVFDGRNLTEQEFRSRITEAVAAWLVRSPSPDTRKNYALDLRQFLAFVGSPESDPESLIGIRPITSPRGGMGSVRRA